MRLRLPKITGRLVLTAAAIVLFVYLVRTLFFGQNSDCSKCQSGGDSATASAPTTTTSTPSDAAQFLAGSDFSILGLPTGWTIVVMLVALVVIAGIFYVISG